MYALSNQLFAVAILSCCVFSWTVPAIAAEPRASHAGATHTPRRPSATGPKRIGVWEDWQAATNQEAGQPVCYAFSRPSSSTPALPGRGDVVLTVTERGGGRDAVALTAGFAYPPNAEMEMSAEAVTLPFYTSGRSAFARDGRAAVALFNRGRQAIARSPGPRGQAVTDNFSLRGFSQAYSAIVKACPSR
jgi:hypothetical protein